MATLATLPSAPESIDQQELIYSDVAEIDALLARFLEAQRAASAKYDEAYLLDLQHERLKVRLIALVQEFGIESTDGSQRKLRVRDFELKVTSAKSSRIDHPAVNYFRYELIKDGRGRRGRAADIFEGKMIYNLRPCARQILADMRVSGELLKLFEKCEIVQSTPILDVSRIAPE